MNSSNDSALKEQIEAYIESHIDEMLEDLITLCSVDSVSTAPMPGMPYGPGAYKALCTAKEICDKYGFKTKEYDGHVVTADTDTGDACLDILAHMDVVAPGDGWSVTEPFSPLIKDDRIYGRGTSDDKGPAIAALYAMRSIRELGIHLHKNCRLILGSDEEIASRDIAHYYNENAEAPMTFSPDAEFPLINVEKGQFRGEIIKKFAQDSAADVSLSHADDKETASSAAEMMSAAGSSAACDILPDSKGVRILSCESGHTINIVPNKAYAVLANAGRTELERIVSAVKSRTGADFSWKITDCDKLEADESDPAGLADTDQEKNTLRLDIEGRAAHASTPELGVNALVIMLQVLAGISAADAKVSDSLKALAAYFPYGDHAGEAVGAACSDKVSGSTTLSPNILNIDGSAIRLRFDARTCAAAEKADTVNKVRERIEAGGFEFKHTFLPAHVVDPESDFIRTLLSCYEEVTGKNGKCLATGGGTYVHELKNGVAFGAVREELDTHMHGADEFMLISDLKTAAVIYALAIARLCG